MLSLRKNNSFSWKDVLSYRNELYGLAIFWIVLFHIYCNVGFVGKSILPSKVYTAISLIMIRGNLGVDVFLFLSAIGLSRSIRNNDIKTFYHHRWNRVFLPYLLLAVPFFIWYDFVAYHDGAVQYALNVSTINYWLTGNHPTWYIAFILVAYLAFPFLFRMDEKSRHISTVTIIVLSILIEYFMCINDVGLYRHAERALSCIPVFMLGLLMSSRVYSSPAIKKIEVVIWMLVGAILFALVSFHPLHIVLVRYLYCFIGMALIVCYSFLRCYFGFNSGGMILNMLGSISLELYVVHVLIIRVINVNCYWQMLHKWCWYLLIPFVSITIAVLLQKCSKKIENKIWKTR